MGVLVSSLTQFSRRLTMPLSLSKDLSVGTRLAAKLPFFLKNPITLKDARTAVKDRLERREESFLAIARKGIYQSPESPYLKLLKLAGCEYGDLEKLVNKDGVEGAVVLEDARLAVARPAGAVDPLQRPAEGAPERRSLVWGEQDVPRRGGGKREPHEPEVLK